MIGVISAIAMPSLQLSKQWFQKFGGMQDGVLYARPWLQSLCKSKKQSGHRCNRYNLNESTSFMERQIVIHQPQYVEIGAGSAAKAADWAAEFKKILILTSK